MKEEGIVLSCVENTEETGCSIAVALRGGSWVQKRLRAPPNIPLLYDRLQLGNELSHVVLVPGRTIQFDRAGPIDAKWERPTHPEDILVSPESVTALDIVANHGQMKSALAEFAQTRLTGVSGAFEGLVATPKGRLFAPAGRAMRASAAYLNATVQFVTPRRVSMIYRSQVLIFPLRDEAMYHRLLIGEFAFNHPYEHVLVRFELLDAVKKNERLVCPLAITHLLL